MRNYMPRYYKQTYEMVKQKEAYINNMLKVEKYEGTAQ